MQSMDTLLNDSECLFGAQDIHRALDRMAEAITKQLHDQNPLVLCVMIGALIPAAHLLTRLSFPLEIDYIHVTRYRGTTRGGDLHWLVEPRRVLQDRVVLVVDDVMDGGLTLSAIVDYCKQLGARAVYSAVMVNKRRPREAGVTLEPDFFGLMTDDRYIYGFGLDYEEYCRNLPAIYALNKTNQDLLDQ